MNETINILLNRRSIRKYKTDQITDEDLNLILEAGKYAPSGGNLQSSIFIVVQNKEMLQTLSQMNALVTGKEFDPFYGAPTVIFALGDKSKVTPVEDASLALSNMFNAAYSLGIGSCWIHRIKEMFESDKGKTLLKEWGIEGDYVGVGSCILGYPDCDQPKPSPRKDNYIVMVK